MPRGLDARLIQATAAISGHWLVLCDVQPAQPSVLSLRTGLTIEGTQHSDHAEADLLLSDQLDAELRRTDFLIEYFRSR